MKNTLTKVIKQLLCKYTDKSLGLIIQESIGRRELENLTDEELVKLLERYLSTGRINYS